MLPQVSNNMVGGIWSTDVLRPLWVAAPAAKKRESVYDITPAGYIIMEPSMVKPSIYVSVFMTC